jgi:hypothetical protein
LIEKVIAQIPERKLTKTYLLDLEDVSFPFGLNPFAIAENAPVQHQQQTADRILHVFEKSFPEASRLLLEKYLGNIAPVFFAHAAAGYSITDIPKFLRDDAFRDRLLASKNLSYFIRQFWEDEYEAMSPAKRQGETASLATRLNRFVRSPIIANIIGQSRTTIDFRKAIENKEILLIKLPLKTLKEDAEFIGTILVSQIHAALFSFADLPEERRPGFSLFVDEFEHFATTDFAEMFAEGRKFGVRLALAHQTRTQIPDGLKVLKSTTMNATTIVCFATNDDASTMADKFPGKAELDMSTIPGDVVKYLVRNGHPHPDVSECATSLLPFMEKNATTGRYKNLPGLTDLNALLIACMRTGNANRDIPVSTITLLIQSLYNPLDDKVVLDAFFKDEESLFINFSKPKPLFYLFCKPNVFAFREQLKAQATNELLLASYWKQKRRQAVDNILGWIRVLRSTMWELAAHPLADTVAPSNSQVASQISNFKKGEAMVKTSMLTSHIQTINPNNPQNPQETKIPTVPLPAQQARKRAILAQTHKQYCKPSIEVEREIMQRLGAMRKETASATERSSQPEREAEAVEELQPSRWQEI